MKDVYGSVADWRRLVPRERDVITGRRTGLRDDKRRDEQQQDSSPRDSSSITKPSLAQARRAWSTPGLAATGAALAAVLVVGGVMAGMALTRTPSSDTSASQDSGQGSDQGQGQVVPGPSGASTGPRGASTGPSGASTGTSSQAPPSPSPSEAAATAVLLSYTGGSLTANECSDASGGGACSRLDSAFDPLSVRCTPTGCTLFYFGGGTGSLAGPLTLSGSTAAATGGCQETTWTVTLTPVGEAVTEGIRHPARLVGTAQTSRPAEVLPATNCLGAAETYRYDATPS